MCTFAVYTSLQVMKIIHPSPVVGLQKKEEGKAYRLMHYVVQQEVEEGVLLYNTLTCALALVTHEEAKNLTAVEDLIVHRFLVPVDHDDKRFCKVLKIGAKLMQKRPKGIRKYTVVTTTGCNARCAYCFEQGTKPVNMTMETAEKVAQYIINHRGDYEEVQTDWFGGEPLYNFKVMDCICTRLMEHDVKFFSCMVTNGYFFSEKMVKKATQLWHLKSCKITLDGTEENYNRTKAYINSENKNPFLRVTNNIGMLLDAGIEVTIRLHVSNENVQEMRELLTMIADRFRKYRNRLSFQILHLFELFGPQARVFSSEERTTLLHEIRNLNDYLVELGLAEPKGLERGIQYYRCMVDSEDAVMIVPDGHLGLCEYHLEDSFFGHIDSDDWNQDVLNRSREYCEEIPECDTCAYYPKCYRLKSCKVHDICFKEQRQDAIENIRQCMLNDFYELKKRKTS